MAIGTVVLYTGLIGAGQALASLDAVWSFVTTSLARAAIMLIVAVPLVVHAVHETRVTALDAASRRSRILALQLFALFCLLPGWLVSIVILNFSGPAGEAVADATSWWWNTVVDLTERGVNAEFMVTLAIFVLVSIAAVTVTLVGGVVAISSYVSQIAFWLATWWTKGDRSKAPAGEPAAVDRIDALERLAALHREGHLTDREFEAEKSRIREEPGS